MKRILVVMLTSLILLGGLLFGNAGVSSTDLHLTTSVVEAVELKIFEDNSVTAANSIDYDTFAGYSNNLDDAEIDVSNTDSTNQKHLGFLAFYANKPFILTVTAEPMTAGGNGVGHEINYNFSIGSVDGQSNEQELEVEKVPIGDLGTSIGRVLDIWAYIDTVDFNSAPADDYKGTMVFEISAL